MNGPSQMRILLKRKTNTPSCCSLIIYFQFRLCNSCVSVCVSEFLHGSPEQYVSSIQLNHLMWRETKLKILVQQSLKPNNMSIGSLIPLLKRGGVLRKLQLQANSGLLKDMKSFCSFCFSFPNLNNTASISILKTNGLASRQRG